MKKITAKILGNCFYEELQKDKWGPIDPLLFNVIFSNFSSNTRDIIRKDQNLSVKIAKENRYYEKLLKKVAKKLNDLVSEMG